MARRTDSVSLWDKGCYKNSFCVSEWPGLTDAIERGGWAVKAGSRKATVKHHGNRHALKNSLLGLPSLRSEAVGYRGCFWRAGSHLMTLRYRSFRLKLCMVFSCFVFSKNEVTQWWCHPHRGLPLPELFSVECGAWLRSSAWESEEADSLQNQQRAGETLFRVSIFMLQKLTESTQESGSVYSW